MWMYYVCVLCKLGQINLKCLTSQQGSYPAENPRIWKNNTAQDPQQYLMIILLQVQGDEFPTVERFMAKYRLDAPAALERKAASH